MLANNVKQKEVVGVRILLSGQGHNPWYPWDPGYPGNQGPLIVSGDAMITAGGGGGTITTPIQQPFSF